MFLLNIKKIVEREIKQVNEKSHMSQWRPAWGIGAQSKLSTTIYIYHVQSALKLIPTEMRRLVARSPEVN